MVSAFKFFHEHPKPCLLDERYEDNHSLVFSDCPFSGFLFQDQVCKDQDEFSDEMYEQGSIDIHHAYVSPSYPFSKALFQWLICANHNFELTCVGVLDNVIMAENNHKKLQVDYEEESSDK